MIFARYKGTDKGFTMGKAYLAKPEVESADAVSFKSIEVRNDAGQWVRAKPRMDMVEWDFEFLEEVYAVVVREVPDLQIGQVVVVEDAVPETADAAGAYSVKGVGFVRDDKLVILDRTNVFPELCIMREETGEWVRVRSVDECLWVTVEGLDGRRSPEEFRFAVDRDGDIMVEPLVECVDAEGITKLTKGKRYYLCQIDVGGGAGSHILVVRNDIGEKLGYLENRFRW
jgi:hypothetical protein